MSKTPRPFVIFVFAREGTSASPRYGGFAARLQREGTLPDHDIFTVALENTAFCFTEDGGLDVFDTVSGVRFSEAALVYLKSWETLPEEAAALAVYLTSRGVPYMDTAPAGMGVSKLVSSVRLWAQQLPVPPGIYVRNQKRLVDLALSKTGQAILGDKFVAKDIVGAKGKHNYLITAGELKRTVSDDSDIQFICQRFIPNNGDYRIGVYVNKARFVIERRGSGETHLNNTSAGGKATYIPVKDFSDELKQLAEQASGAVNLQISGVDIIVDSATGRPYILEVNQGSQIVTGAFTQENKAAFAEGLAEAVNGEYAATLGLEMIGRQVTAVLPELGVTTVTAKIDSGAYTSSLHAQNIHLESTGNKAELVFEVVPNGMLQTQTGQPVTIRTNQFTERYVRSSNGQREKRFSIVLEVVIKGRRFSTPFTLSNRANMKYPMLVGRQALNSRFLVHVGLAADDEATAK